uniref:DB domain-containing protein n=1 Tax=Angiostrongylus cantonensis TaxID=6313 RepID=A0A0K0DPT7_ANGCA
LSIFILYCGGGAGCCPRPPPPPVVTCGSGCQQGYQCGTYGCSKRKAFSALTARIDGVLVGDEYAEEAYTLPLAYNTSNLQYAIFQNPNNIFHMCCEARGLPDACLRHCHFNRYTATSLERMFHKNDACPIEAAHEIHYCAAQGLDHTKVLVVCRRFSNIALVLITKNIMEQLFFSRLLEMKELSIEMNNRAIGTD